MSFPALSPFSPLAIVLNDIQRAIDARLYYPALLMAVTVPEICSALALDKSVFVKEKHYVAFVDKYTTPKSLGCDGIQCYRLRGGIVHRANLAGHGLSTADAVMFFVPESKSSLHALTIDVGGSKKAACFDLVQFCAVMVGAARAWYDDNQKDPKIEANMKSLVRYCENGLAPYAVGFPVVASGT